MDKFRIIAIRTGETEVSLGNFLETKETSLYISYLKALQKNAVYSFYNHYSFPSNDFNEILYDSSKDIDLYSLKLSDKNIPVNINAIVGENGSGKSTLIELIYWINYNLGCMSDLLETREGKKYLIDSVIDMQILYSVSDQDFFVLKIEQGRIIEQALVLIDNRVAIKSGSSPKEITDVKDLTDFFYTVVINYSQYALNAKEVGDWVTPLFHKNDGYQTPIVLNPMREDGNIDINKEKLLLSRRLQANVLEPLKSADISDSLRNLANGKIAKQFQVEYNPEYFKDVEESQGLREPVGYAKLKSAIESYNLPYAKEDSTFYNEFKTNIVDYVYYKLHKIVYNYPMFERYRDGDKSIKEIDLLLLEILGSPSHVTFKVKGALLHLKYFDKIYKNIKPYIDIPFLLEIDDLSTFIEKEVIPNEKFFVNTYMTAMPSFFNVEILPADGALSIGSLSSGEKQRVYSLSSIAYHLMNLNSVEEQKLKDDNKIIKYRFINLILDEIELYYHPEWQRRYVADLLDYLQKINPDNLKNIAGINIMFITHSPFILSDIPTSNILYLEIDKTDKKAKQRTIESESFGANIHELLANDFFMANGFVGQFAVERIEKLITFFKGENEDFDEDTAKQLINLQGDRLIRARLTDMYNDHFNITVEEEMSDEDYRDWLQSELDKIKK